MQPAAILCDFFCGLEDVGDLYWPSQLPTRGTTLQDQDRGARRAQNIRTRVNGAVILDPKYEEIVTDNIDCVAI